MLMIKNKYIVIFFFIFSYASAENSKSKQLDKLFKNLGNIENINQGNFLEEQIWELWNQHNDINLTNRLELGTQLMYQGDYQYALKIFNNVIESDPSWSEAWNKRATLLFYMKEYQKSLNDIKKVLNLEPRHFGAIAGRAQIFIRLEQYDNAIKDLKKVKEINPLIQGNELIKELEKLVKGIQI